MGGGGTCRAAELADGAAHRADHVNGLLGLEQVAAEREQTLVQEQLRDLDAAGFEQPDEGAETVHGNDRVFGEGGDAHDDGGDEVVLECGG